MMHNEMCMFTTMQSDSNGYMTANTDILITLYYKVFAFSG